MTSLAATPTRHTNGPIVGHRNGPTRYINLMGGIGTVLLHRLLSGPQLLSLLDIAERVDFIQGGSCGLHQHTRTEEIYYVLHGEGIVDMDGERLNVKAGDLVITPLNSTHRIGAREGADLTILVLEVLPGEGRRSEPTKIAMPELLADQPARPAGVRIASLDLAEHFTGPWGPFELAALEPDAILGPRTASQAEQFLYVTDGHLRVDFGGQQEFGESGLYLVVPPGMPWTVVTGTDSPAELVITQVGLR